MFQRLMDRVLRLHQRYVISLDDVVMYSREWETHSMQVQKLLDSLGEAGLTANPKKCKLAFTESNYLGYTIGQGLVKPQEAKINSIKDWPRPSTKTQVKSFLGLANYYRRFATLVAPLTETTRKQHSRMVKWSEKMEESFAQPKRALTSHPVPVAPDLRSLL